VAPHFHRHEVTPTARDHQLDPGPPSWPPWICPRHAKRLEEAGDELRCPHGDAYTRVDGIPRFVDASSYADAFGEQWRRFHRTQLDSYTGTTLSRDRARRCLGPLWDDLAGKNILECGCGAGRFTEVLLERSARVTSIDLSRAVEANAANFPPGASHRIAQADVLALPFPPGSFDVVFALGVVQHTPDPERTIAALYEQVRPGGALVFDHYSRHVQWLVSVRPLVREVLRRLPSQPRFAITDALVRALLPVHRRAGRFGIVLRRISPVEAYYTTYPELSNEHQIEWARLDTHDALTDRFKHFRTCDEIARTLERLGARDIWCESGGNGVEARATRPLA